MFMKGITDLVTPRTHSTKKRDVAWETNKNPTPFPPVTHEKQMASQRSNTGFPLIFSASARLWMRKARTSIHKLEHQPG